jgi:hypothetical protein
MNYMVVEVKGIFKACTGCALKGETIIYAGGLGFK